MGGASKASEPLQTTYYCQAEGKKTLDVVVELKGRTQTSETSVPQRFVLVIDVSGSMAKTTNNGRNLLERVKIFAQQFIGTTTSTNWLSIVTFADEAETVLPMTQMNSSGKNEAETTVADINVETLHTNLTDGLFRGLDEAARSYPGHSTHDCIILFTDGEPNRGNYCDQPSLLIEEYCLKVQQYKENGQLSNVQLAAITIDGEEQAELLCEIRKKLSSEAFYVLNLQCDFEADMFIPSLLRQSSFISDLCIELKTVKGVTFHSNHQFNPGLKETNDEIGRKYFINFLPDSVAKQIYIKLDISKLETNENNVLEVNIKYLDHSLKTRTSKDVPQLGRTPMLQVRPSSCGDLSGLSATSFALLEETCAFTFDSNLSSTWESAQVAYANVLKQKGRMESYSSIEQASTHLKRPSNLKSMESYTVSPEKISAATTNLSESIDKITELLKTAIIVLGERSMYSRLVYKYLNDYIKNLKYASDNIESMSWARLQAILSSIETEMPTATGVFEPESSQIFMPPKLEEQLADIAKKLNPKLAGSMDQYQEKVCQRKRTRKLLNEAIKVRNAEEIENAIDESFENGIDVATILLAQDILLDVRNEDTLIKKIIDFMKKKGKEKLMMEAVDKFKTFQYVDKTGDVEKAEQVVKKRRLEKERDKIYEDIRAARQNHNETEEARLNDDFKIVERDLKHLPGTTR